MPLTLGEEDAGTVVEVVEDIFRTSLSGHFRWDNKSVSGHKQSIYLETHICQSKTEGAVRGKELYYRQVIPASRTG